MANLNLSEFTEKLFVADADHTFIWDTAASISKRVSRNSWLNSGTLTSDAPVTISQTWNNAAVAFTGLKVNAVSTNSAAASLLLDLQVGITSLFSVRKDGAIIGSNTNGIFAGGVGNFFAGRIHVGDYNFSVGSNSLVQIAIEVDGADAANAVILNKDAGIYWSSVASAGNIIGLRTTTDLALRRDAANTLALRNGSAAQTFRVYNTFPGTGNNEFGSLNWVDQPNEFQITTGQAGSGTGRALCLRAGGGINIRIGGAPGTLVWQFGTSTGHFLAATDNSVDIGASGANRPRNVYVGTAITAGGGISGQNFGSSAGGYFNWATRSNIFSPADGVIRLANDAQTDFNRLQFGGTSSSFPALKRSTTTLQARLADDSAFAPIQGKLTTDTAFTATTVTPTGFITLYDSTGTAYKVPCVPA